MKINPRADLLSKLCLSGTYLRIVLGKFLGPRELGASAVVIISPRVEGGTRTRSSGILQAFSVVRHVYG